MTDAKNVNLRRTEYAMWANEHALVSGVVILIGGIVVYAIFIGCFITIYEYPRGYREDSVCIRRRGQDFFEPFVSIISGIFFDSYGVRAVVYLLLCLPCGGCLPTLTGGVSLLFASLLYFISALRHETRKSPGALPRKEKWKRKSTIRAPKHPPPRLKHYITTNDSNSPVLKDPHDAKNIVKPNIILTVSRDESENNDNHVHHFESVANRPMGDNSMSKNIENIYLTDIPFNKRNNGYLNHGFDMESNRSEGAGVTSNL
ncbi:cytochrome b-245 light chain-like isoform X2 [Anneissia japonica]|uniref:cytochrome b-245 light chain-like isoform X2 n=1 Tax=Anneissia japonica TaxID=1529436 RepID=UPI0014258127|nr:cytochrome b-245 light chain-like isoform X2 [Anneissia japonica]